MEPRPTTSQDPYLSDGETESTPREPPTSRVEIRFDGNDWCIDHVSLSRPLAFRNLDEAEERAAEIGRAARRRVVVCAQDGQVIASFDPGLS
jgi:hypothetical protein